MEVKMGELVCKDLITQDNIKSEFKLFIRTKKDDTTFIPPSINYYIKQQYVLLGRYNLKCEGAHLSEGHYIYCADYKNVYEAMFKYCSNGIIPKRFFPKFKELDLGPYYSIVYKNKFGQKEESSYRTKGSYKRVLGKYKKRGIVISVGKGRTILHQLVFKESLISLLIQKKSELYSVEPIINLFKDLVEKDKGIEFDVYMDNWSNRLLNDTNLGKDIFLLQKKDKELKQKWEEQNGRRK
jgi:hypothetical protein